VLPGYRQGRVRPFYLPVLPLYGFTTLYTNPYLLIYYLPNFKLPVLVLVWVLKRKKTKFGFPHQWKFLPFGLKNAPAEFQRVLDRVFSGLEVVKCYIDDIIVFSTSSQKHRTHLADVFAKLRLHGLKLHPGKCKFYCDRVEYLGHMIFPGGLGVVANKVEVVMSIPKPRDVSKLRAFVGLYNYYRKFVKTFSAIAKPLTMLTRLDQPWNWGDE
jgi:hypothetical protein